MSGLGGAGFLLAEKWTHNVFEVHRVSDRILVLLLVLGESVFTFVSVYAPQVGRMRKKNFFISYRNVSQKYQLLRFSSHWVTGTGMLVRRLVVLRTCMAVLVMAPETLKVSGF